MRTLVFAALLLIGQGAYAQYQPVDSASTVKFTIKNFGFRVSGFFTGLKGEIRFDPAHAADARIDVTVEAATVNTDNSMRDDHLRSADYFDAKNAPRIRFVSEKIMPGHGRHSWIVTGKLTIKNHTKEISIPCTVIPSGGGYLFDGSFSLNRRDFEVGGASTISDNLDLSLHILAK
ncbi:MAG TPA: YceI family protein [Puia sp.]|jgi:polyisoprenoid-binding protein YceI